MEFIGKNWKFLIFMGIFLYLMIRRGDLMTRKGGCCGGNDHGEYHTENYIDENERSEKSCCCSHKEKK